MGLVLATTAGLIVWIVLWALGSKPIDSFMIAVVIIIVGATVRTLGSHLPRSSSE
jgi:hypothetical protein